MTAGKRNRLITFHRPDGSEDDYGGQSPGTAAVAQAWAEVLFGTGQERRQAGQEGGTQAATFIVLWTPQLAALDLTHSIAFDDLHWDITSKVPVGLNREIHFTATRQA